ncbi:MAG: cytochrome c [Acidobacteriota bacterium]
MALGREPHSGPGRRQRARKTAVHLFTLISVGVLSGGLWPETLHAQARGAAAPGTSAPVVGVYTRAQAERGKERFITSCGNCHGVDLKGAAERGPALAGDPFMKIWQERTAGTLFTKIKSDMPRNRPGSLTDDVYMDIVSFILQTNAFAEGPKDLSAAVLDSVPLAKGDLNAQKVVPNFAMVALVGCLAKGPDNTWLLTNTTEPIQSKDEPPTPDDLKQAGAQPLGSNSFQLISIVPFKPDSNSGHKMAAKGLLYRAANENRLDVTSLQAVASSCANQ